jgi:hypothetical protein
MNKGSVYQLDSVYHKGSTEDAIKAFNKRFKGAVTYEDIVERAKKADAQLKEKSVSSALDSSSDVPHNSSDK